MRTASTVLLGIGFNSTAVAGWWNAQSSVGANIGAGALYLFGLIIGALGLILFLVTFIRLRQRVGHGRGYEAAVSSRANGGHRRENSYQ